MKKFRVKIVGMTPLLMNKPPAYGKDDKLKVFNPNLNLDEEALARVYSIDGVISQPADHFLQAMIKAASDISVKGKGKKKYSSMLGGMVEIEPYMIPHKKTDFDLFPALTVNPTTKGRNLTKRPRFMDWELEFILKIDDEIPPIVAKEALERAGKYVGIGDWRPAKKGFHGKFMVMMFEEIVEGKIAATG